MKTSNRVKFVLIFLSLTMLLVGPTAAQPQPALLQQPARFSFFGMNTYVTGLERISRDGEDGIATLVSLGRAAGVEWAREELSWGNLERRGKGRWDWKYFDQRLLQLAESGYGIVGMLLTTPAWARVADCEARIQRYAAAGVKPQDYWCPPANPQDFADYVYAVVERYDGDGYDDAPGSPRVAAWQIWNEPNAWETWPGSPAAYGAILQAGYAAAKAADPTAIVATGGVYVLDGSWADSIGHSDGLRFLDAALAAVPSAWHAFDALAIHPYMPDVAPDQPGILARVTLWGRITTARDWLITRTQRYGGSLRLIWISEVGWSTCTPDEPDCYALLAGDEQPALTDQPLLARDYRLTSAYLPRPLSALIGKSEEEQANYLVRSHAIALALGVQHLNYFQFEDKFDGSLGNFWEEASILHTKDRGYRPKLAYTAYTALTQQLAGAAFVDTGVLNSFNYDPHQQRNPAARYHLRFLRPDNVLVDVLWQTDDARNVALPLDPGRAATLVLRNGAQSPLAAQDGSVRVTVGQQPIYVRQALPPVLSVSPPALMALAEQNGPPRTLALTIANAGSGDIHWRASSDAAWLRPITPAGQGWRSTLWLTVDPAGLALGSYSATVTVTSDGGTQPIPVRLLVLDKVWQLVLPVVGG